MPDARSPDKSMTTVVRELWQLVLTYLKQETIDPIKGLGRFLLWGTMGSLLLGIGAVMIVLAWLRFLQTETGDIFDGNWSFAPYVIVFLVAGGVAVWAGSRIGAAKQRHEREEGS